MKDHIEYLHWDDLGILEQLFLMTHKIDNLEQTLDSTEFTFIELELLNEYILREIKDELNSLIRQKEAKSVETVAVPVEE